MKVGIKFNSTCQISQGVPMAAIILRLYELLFTQTVVLEEFISLTDCTVNNNFLQNSSFSYLFKNNNEEIKKLASFKNHIFLKSG